MKEVSKHSINSQIGNDCGADANGALDLLEKGSLNATLKKIIRVISHLKDAEAAGGPDFTDQKSLLVLIAKSVAVGAVRMPRQRR